MYGCLPGLFPALTLDVRIGIRTRVKQLPNVFTLSATLDQEKLGSLNVLEVLPPWMDTRGYYAYRFRGRYYILYRHYDSYPEGLGAWIVQSIPQDSEKYQQWLKAQRTKFTKWEQVLDERILSISNTRLQQLPFSNATARDERVHAEPSLSMLLDDRLQAELLPCFRVPKRDHLIEYTYVIDLDREVFTMDNSIHFVLNKIPQDVWIKSLGRDDEGQTLAFPSLLPPDCIADLAALRFEGKATEEILDSDTQQTETSIVRPKGFLDFPARLRHGPLLLAHLWDFITFSLEDEMPFILRGLTPDDFTFREIAFAFLSIAAGLSSTLKLVDGHRVRSSSSATWDGIILGDRSEYEVVVLSDLAMGHHAEGTAPGSAPEAKTYWFQGAVIRLEADLATSDRVEQATKHAIAFAQGYQSLQEPFDAVLLSIEHVILLHVVGSSVQRTATLPLLDIAVHYTEHPRHRYPEGALQQFMDAHKAEEEENKREIKEYKMKQKESKKSMEKRDGDETEEEEEVQVGGVVVPEVPVREKGDTIETQHEDGESEMADRDAAEPWPIAHKGFFAMMHLFEAAAVRSMAPEKANEGIFPSEVYEIILEYVDNVTSRACACVSRKFRRCCLIALRLVEDTVIHGLDPNARATQSWNTSSFILSRGPQGRRLPFQLQSYYYRYTERETSTVWVVICGNSQRSTLLSKFWFVDYMITRTWREAGRQNILVQDEDLQHQNSHSTEIDSLQAEIHSPHYEDQGSVLDDLEPVAQMDTAQLYKVWHDVVQFCRLPQRYDDIRFTLPSHTRELVIETRWLKICVGYIRIKRPDAIVGLAEAWDLALQEAEAEEMLERAKKQDHQQISVIIAVKLSAMLYRWNAETQQLESVNSNRLNILAEGDREIVEEFLIALQEPLAELKEVDAQCGEKLQEEWRLRRDRSDPDSD
ncbi:hypothetical protein MMC27_007847 [Xylographa pallens]|nr:hypothetical protein [Xylographa pallens]